MPYRDDLDAAHCRMGELENELAELKEEGGRQKRILDRV